MICLWVACIHIYFIKKSVIKWLDLKRCYNIWNLTTINIYGKKQNKFNVQKTKNAKIDENVRIDKKN